MRARRGPWGLLLAGALALAASLGAPPARAAAPELRAQVERLLSGIEAADPAEPLRRLGPAAAEVLLQLAQEEGRPLLRLRAIEALGHLPTSGGRDLLLALVERRQGATEPAAVYELAAAARALGAFGATGERALLPLLEHDSADVREGAAAGLRRGGGEAGQRALRARLPREKDRGVRAAIGRALKG